jgi:hypothetical protein
MPSVLPAEVVGYEPRDVLTLTDWMFYSMGFGFTG